MIIGNSRDPSGNNFALLELTRQIFLLAGIVLACAGCAAVGPQAQRLVSKPNMVFSESPVFNYTDKLLPQTEPGFATTGGAQASGCTSCK
jgi:hypothetical protein